MGKKSKKWWFSSQNVPKMLNFKEYFSLLSLHPFLCEEFSLQRILCLVPSIFLCANIACLHICHIIQGFTNFSAETNNTIVGPNISSTIYLLCNVNNIRLIFYIENVDDKSWIAIYFRKIMKREWIKFTVQLFKSQFQCRSNSVKHKKITILKTTWEITRPFWWWPQFFHCSFLNFLPTFFQKQAKFNFCYCKKNNINFIK